MEHRGIPVSGWSLERRTEPQAETTLKVGHRCRNERVEQNLPEITQPLINPCSRFCERRRRESRRINARVCDSRTLSPRGLTKSLSVADVSSCRRRDDCDPDVYRVAQKPGKQSRHKDLFA